MPGAKTDLTAPNEHAAAAARDAHQVCAGSDRGSAHSAPRQHANGRANGTTTERGNPHANGGGNANAKGGNANAKGGGNANARGSDTATDATAPGRSQDHPSGPPATPGAARNGPPG